MDFTNQLADNIINMRKQANFTQEDLATRLNISYQAVSKWETKQSSPDIALLPLLAEIFSVTVDELFGIVPIKSDTISANLPWTNDDTLHVVAYKGHKLLKVSKENLSFEYRGDALNVDCALNITCEGVTGSVTAGGDISCDSIGNDANCGGNITCDCIGNDANCGGNITCDCVGNNAMAGNIIIN